MVSASDYDLINYAAVVDGQIVSTDASDWMDFSPRFITLEPDKRYEVTVTYELSAAGAVDQVEVWAYSLRADGDDANSEWYYLYKNDAPDADGSYTFEIGPTRYDYLLAMEAGETRLIIETFGMKVTGVAATAKGVWEDLPYGAPVALDSTPSEKWGEWWWFNNLYSDACRVWDDVVLAAWDHQDLYDDTVPDGGGAWSAYEARAARFVEGDVPSLELGPEARGPINSDLPGWNPAYETGDYWDGHSSNYRLQHVGRIGDGLAFLQVGRMAYLQNIMGYVVRVDPDTLQVDFVRSVHADNFNWAADEWGWAPAYGPNRVLFSTELQYLYHAGSGNPNYAPFPGADPATGYGGNYILLLSFAPDGTELARRYVGAPTDGLFEWENVVCIADCGEYFISFTVDPGYPASAQTVSVWRHKVVDNLPADDPVLLHQEGRTKDSSYGWDFDGTYCTAMPNGKVYILENDYQDWYRSISARFRVFDPATNTLTVKASRHGSMYGYAGHSWDWMSIEPIDSERALFSIGEFWSSDENGLVVGIVDERSGFSNEQLIYPYEARLQPYRRRDLYSSQSATAVYLGNGRVVGLINNEDDETPYPPTLDDPAAVYQTTVMPTYLFRSQIDGDPIDDRRRFWQ